MEKRYLFTPGPTPVPPEVLAAGAEPIVHHRGADFRDDLRRHARPAAATSSAPRSDVLLFTASGTGAMESAVANLCAPGDRVAVVSHGSFGERWVAICEQHDLDVQAIRYEWGETPDPDEVGAAVRESGVELVFCQQSDTSTGVVSDVRAIKEAVGDATARRRRDLLARRRAARDRRVGHRRRRLRLAEGADVAAGARDGLRPRARARASRSRRAASTSTGSANKKAQDEFDAAFTPAVSLIRSLDVALGLLLDDGLEAAFERHVRLGRATRAGVKAMGLELFSPDDDTAAVVTAMRARRGSTATSSCSICATSTA